MHLRPPTTTTFPVNLIHDMANPPEDRRHNISLEDLLRFKRAERPDQAFWEQFDQQLHQRMLQTLVRKDPWYVQLMHALSGTIAQSTAVAGLAAVLAVVVLRPAFIASNESSQTGLVAQASTRAATEAHDHAGPAATVLETAPITAEADYSIDGLSVVANTGSDTVTRDFGLDQINVASYDRSAYSADIAFPGLATAGVTSSVY